MEDTHMYSNSLAHCYELSFSSINEECKNQSEEEVSESIKANESLREIIIDDSVSESIWDAVISNPHIMSVAFQRTNVKAEVVLRVLARGNIKSIRFTGDGSSVLNMDDEDFFLEHVQMNNTLESMELWYVSFGNTFIKALAQSTQSSVIRLEIYKGSVAQDGFNALVEALPRFRALQKLDFHDDDLVIDNESAHAFSQAARNMRGAVAIHLRAEEAGANEMLATFITNISLTNARLDCLRPVEQFPSNVVNFWSKHGHLFLGGKVHDVVDDSIRERALEVVAQIASGTRKTQDLTLCRCGFGPAETERLCSALVESGTVESLSLAFNRVGQQGLLSLGRILPRYPTLTKLDLSHNKLSDDMICLFCDALVPVNSLEEMDLSNNAIGDGGAAAIAGCIANEKLSPKTLILALNRIGYGGVVSFSKCLANDKLSLRTLDLGYNRFGVTGAKAIANTLASPTLPLEALKLDGMQNLVDDAYESLGDALKINTKLKELSMNHFRSAAVTAEGVRAFLDGVKVHPSLQEVRLEGSGLSLLQLDELHYYLELNKGARDLLELQPPLPQILWPRVLKKADNCRNDGERRRAPDVLHYFVKEKCDLFTHNIHAVREQQSTLSGRKRPAPSEE